MPVMDGIEATKQIKVMKNKDHIPIIAMTASVMNKDKENSKNAGMVGHISKPIDIEDLKDVLLKFITPKVNMIEASQTGQKELNDNLLSNGVVPKKTYGIDLDELLNKLSGDKDLVSQLLLNFTEQYKEFEEELDESKIGTQEYKEFIHTLKGVSGNLSIKEVYDICSTIGTIDNIEKRKELNSNLNKKLNEVINNINVDILKRDNSSINHLSIEEVRVRLDEFILNIDQDYYMPIENIQKFIDQLRYYVKDEEIEELSTFFDKLEYKNAKEKLLDIKDKL